MIRIVRIFLLCFALVPFAAHADQNQPKSLPTTAHPALWKVADADTTIYLFGTVHALPKGMVWLDGPLARAFAGSDQLVTEIIEAKPAEMVPIVRAKAMLPEGKNLRDLLDAADRAAFEAALKAQGMPVEALDRFKPWYAAVALSTYPLMAAGFDPASGVDAALSARAEATKQPHGALETPAFQLGLFDSLSMPVQQHYLREVLRRLPTIKGELLGMIRAWQTGNAAKLAQLMNKDNDSPAMTRLLLTDRNRTWARWIKARLGKPGKVFVAVGAGHLAGKGSVQDQMRALGIRVSRVQ